ncbi:hypothetical protein [Sinorhizobium sp. BG8]|uniref:hypothetical protein n=1 Tax=Sinorhizobium sp. BG8 TaxID=2613773 RepID=UPI001FED9206|nr:hypothetical protein [Sinorhizobium sp. BG8]
MSSSCAGLTESMTTSHIDASSSLSDTRRMAGQEPKPSALPEREDNTSRDGDTTPSTMAGRRSAPASQPPPPMTPKVVKPIPLHA